MRVKIQNMQILFKTFQQGENKVAAVSLLIAITANRKIGEVGDLGWGGVTWLRVDIGDIIAQEDLVGGVWAEEGRVIRRLVLKLHVSPVTKRPSAA